MKRNILNKILIASSALLVGGLSSCEDYLTLYPTDSITKEDFWNTSNDVDNVRAAAYYQLTQNVTSIIEWGEVRSDNLALNDMKQTRYRYMQDAVLQPNEGMFNWAAMYKGINLCNEVLDNGQRMIDQGIDPSFTNSDWLPIKAEMVSLRALYYFYLVRAFRNVPYVTHSVDTDEAAMAARINATEGSVVLDSVINQVEGVLNDASTNYGSTLLNKGRWTKRSVRTLLADLYLWRAAMVKGSAKKGFPLTNAEGTQLSEDEEKALASKLLQKSVEYSSAVIADLKREYIEALDRLGVSKDDRLRKQQFPLNQNYYLGSNFITEDQRYENVFGDGGSKEIIFELLYDGSNIKNSALNNLFYGDPNGTFTAGTFVANPQLFGVVGKVDPKKGYGKTDFRFLSYGRYTPRSTTSQTPVIKGVATSVQVFDAADVTRAVGYSFRSNGSNNASWPIYRLADVMMINAEAIARLSTAPLSNPNFSKLDAFRACDALFRVNNPALDSVNTASTLYLKRFKELGNETAAELSDRYATYGVDDPLNLVYCERQREFLGEGKRWFDLVRECEYRGATKEVLSDWMGATTNVRNRLRSIWSLYNPIYSEELKVNGVGYGNGDGKLVQNPVWEKYMPKM